MVQVTSVLVLLSAKDILQSAWFTCTSYYVWTHESSCAAGKALISQSDSIPVPGWCKQHSAGTLKPPWPSSEWQAPWPLSRRPPARSRLHSYTVGDNRGSRGGLGINEKWIAPEGRLDIYNPPFNQSECFFINIWPPSSVSADCGVIDTCDNSDPPPVARSFRDSQPLHRLCFRWKP